MRLFLGLGLPDSVTETLARFQTGLGPVRWVERRNMHITLKFLGEVETGDAEDLDSVLQHLDVAAFTLTLAGMGSFGKGRDTRAVWAGVEPSPELTHLQAKVERLCQMQRFKAEQRKFTPHVTLAWTKGVKLGRIDAYMAQGTLLRAGPFAVAEVNLYRSHLGAKGADYEVLASYPLAN
ncbi:MAG: RNA 2',3'-cyclic phosphodiesterase [Rhodospirillales bacterium]